MLNTELITLKLSLCRAMEGWINEQATNDEWLALNTCIGDFTEVLMADAAFTVLLAQMKLSEYLRQNDLEP
jgi:hypothetical protein